MPLHTSCAIKTPREDTSCQAKRRCVRPTQDLALVRKLRDAHHRAENLLAHQFGIIGHVCKNSWLDEETTIEFPISTSSKAHPGSSSFIDVTHDAIKLKAINLWPLLHAHCKGIANRTLLCHANTLFDKFVVNALVH